ncbi:MAG TPA: phenylalanine--tRNA ligase subunit beta [Candidatus Paceibacterota bacterium]|nr:phenylalanine--tRNA ligase subunit beta [Candidatus Paceibacterota bacterium]
MKFSWKWLVELSGTDVSAQEAAAVLSAKACETEVGDDGNLEADILPNRPDLLAHLWLARELASLTGGKFRGPDYSLNTGGDAVRVNITDAAACPRYSALVVRGVTVGPSPESLKMRLETLGLSSVNNVVDVMNVVMLELGQPLHAFDLAKLQGGITVRMAAKGEKLTALDDARTEYGLDPSVLVIADGSGPVAIAGIKGGASTAVSGGTKDILIEAANFSPSVVRAGTARLNLRTDASVRFSYGIAPAMTVSALARAAQLLKDVAGGTAESAAVDAYPHPSKPVTLMLDTGYVRGLLGADVDDDAIARILSGLGFTVSGSGASMSVAAPVWRTDIRRQEDLIEEVGRVYGYENIPSRAPVVYAYDEWGWLNEDEDVPWDEYGFIRERTVLAHRLAGMGYAEVYNYAFISDELKEIFGLTTLRELAKPQSEEYRYLRPSLLPRLVLNVRDNLRFANVVRLFETGHRFTGDGRETSRLALAVGAKKDTGELFFELKGAADLMLQEMGITDIQYDDVPPFAFATLALWCAPGRAAEVKTGNGTAVGVVGLLHPAIAAKLKVRGAVAVAEFDLRTLIRHAQGEREYEPLPKYPAVERDISMLVNDDVRIRDILQTIQRADASDLVRDVDVVDIFVPTGDEKLAPEFSRHEYGKSVAVRMVYRSDERTLTDTEVTAAETAIKKALQDELGALIR